MVGLLGILLFASTNIADTFDFDALLDICNAVKACQPGIASYAVSAVKNNDDIVFLNTYGHANKEENISTSNETRYTIGSITKSFTAYLVAKSVNEGKLRWDERLTDAFAKYGVDFSLIGKDRDQTLTIRDAMSHRTGLKTYDWLLVDGRNFSKEYWMTKLLPLFEQEINVRYDFLYNNWLYSLAGYLLELVENISFEDQVRETFFVPLNMTESMFVTDQAYRELSGDQFAMPYKEGANHTLYPLNKSVMEYIGPHNAAGGIVSTASDMAKYMGALLNAYNEVHGSILNGTILRYITEPSIILNGQLGDQVVIGKPDFPVTEKFFGYGMGYIAANYRELPVINHGGATYGHYSQMSLIPDENVGVFVVLSGDDYYELQHQILRLIYIYFLDVLMDETPWLNTTTICSYPEPWQTSERSEKDLSVLQDDTYSREADAVDLSIYEGVYNNPVYPDLQISLVNGQLQFILGTGNGTLYREQEAHSFHAITNMPTDPMNIPDSEKEITYFKFNMTPSEAVEGVEFKYIQKYYFSGGSSSAPDVRLIFSGLVLILILLYS